MWVVAKIKLKNLNIFKKDLIKKVGSDVKFYHPKIEYDKYFGNKVKCIIATLAIKQTCFVAI